MADHSTLYPRQVLTQDEVCEILWDIYEFETTERETVVVISDHDGSWEPTVPETVQYTHRVRGIPTANGGETYMYIYSNLAVKRKIVKTLTERFWIWHGHRDRYPFTLTDKLDDYGIIPIMGPSAERTRREYHALLALLTVVRRLDSAHYEIFSEFFRTFLRPS